MWCRKVNGVSRVEWLLPVFSLNYYAEGHPLRVERLT